MVTSGGVSATVTLVGHYTLANFTSSTDGSGHVMITDPPVVAQQPSGGPGPQGANMALFGTYIAPSFTGLAGPQGGIAIVDALQSVDQALLASHPKN
jgi:hypothetical protein